jgi:hypothetical protein
MQASPSVEHGSKPRAGKRQRRIGMTMLVAGIIVLVAAFAPTSANAVIPNSALTPAGPATFNESCTDNNDATTHTLLAGLFPPDGVLVLPAQMTTNAINSPSDGEDFTLSVTFTTTLPAFLVSVAQSAGTTTLVQTNSTLPLTATSGATGTFNISDPGPEQINLPGPTDPAIDLPFTQGPFDVTFTRSGTGPVVITPGTIVTTSTAGSLPLQLACTPTDVTPLTLNDQEGPPPPPTSVTVNTLPFTPTTAAPAATGTSGSGTSGSGTGAPVTTSGTALARTGGFHAELLYLGIALLGAGYALSLTGKRVARAAGRSD